MTAAPGPQQPDEVRRGSLRAQQQLDDLRAENERPSRLGCSLVAHRDLAFCSSCAGVDAAEELYGWRLLAIAERGVPAQPVRDTEEGRR